MCSPDESGDIARFDVRNIGGIRRTEVAIPTGVTVLTGKNATNRTSLLQAVIAAMGSTAATLRGDADSGRVRLDLEGESYERRLERAGTTTRYEGEGYLDDVTVAELFAFLLESNEARRSVATGGELRELLMRPVDTAAINADIERLEAEKSELSAQLAAIEDRKGELTTLESRRDELTEEIEATRAALAEKEAEIDETDIEKHRQDRDEFEETLAELRTTRSELASVRRDIESQSESIASLRRELSELEAELDGLSAEPDGDQERLERQIRELRTRRQSLNEELSELQGIIQYNEERLEAEAGETAELLGRTARQDGTVSDGLLRAETGVVCWTCGSAVERDQIETTLDQLRDRREAKMAELESVKSTLGERKRDREELEAASRRRREITAKVDDIEDERDRRQERLEQLKRRRSELTAEVERLEETVQSLESEEFDTVLSLHREANQLEFELDRLESDREEVRAEIDEIEAALGRAERLRERRSAVAESLTEKRTRIERLEKDAVDAFNEHMAATLDILEYDNVERIWIERRQSDSADDGAGANSTHADDGAGANSTHADDGAGANSTHADDGTGASTTHADDGAGASTTHADDGAGANSTHADDGAGASTTHADDGAGTNSTHSFERATFELHIVRTTANGTAYEDTVAHLSESEREVTGLVFALAGYLVHDLHETVPFMLLDSLEAIDADRIARLVDYLAEYVTYLVVALLPEDAAALDDSYTRITSI